MAKKKEKGPHGGSKPLVTEHRDWVIADYYLKGYRYGDIQLVFEREHKQQLTYTQIADSIKRIRRYWRRQSARKFALKSQMVLEQINLIYKDACDAWEASKRPTVTEKWEPADSDSDNQLPTTIEGITQHMKLIERSVKTGSGDPRFLDIRLDCLRKVCELYGLDEPIKVDMVRQIEIIEVNPISRQILADQKRNGV